MKINNMVLAVMMMTSFASFAGGDVGNGGDVIVCSDGNVEFLDVKEGRDRGLDLKLQGTTLRAMVTNALERARKYEQKNVDLLVKYSLEMIEDLEGVDRNPNYVTKSIAFTNETLTDLPDSKEVSLPSGCEIKQLVIQKSSEILSRFDKRYTINKGLWSKLSVEEKAAVVMHEAWYRIAIEDSGKTDIDSRSTRLLNQLTFSNGINELSAEDFESERQLAYTTGVTLNKRLPTKFDGVERVLVAKSTSRIGIYTPNRIAYSDLHDYGPLRLTVIKVSISNGGTILESDATFTDKVALDGKKIRPAYSVSRIYYNFSTNELRTKYFTFARTEIGFMAGNFSECYGASFKIAEKRLEMKCESIR